MQRYKNLHGDSGVIAYEIGARDIKVKFRDGAIYLYNYDSAGAENVEKMKALAKQGAGLSTFISTHVRERYAARLK